MRITILCSPAMSSGGIEVIVLHFLVGSTDIPSIDTHAVRCDDRSGAMPSAGTVHEDQSTLWVLSKGQKFCNLGVVSSIAVVHRNVDVIHTERSHLVGFFGAVACSQIHNAAHAQVLKFPQSFAVRLCTTVEVLVHPAEI